MAYFLKKSKVKGRTYLAIYESFYNPEKKETSHKQYRALGSLESLIESGIADPDAHFRKEIQALNEKRKSENARKISDKSPMRYLGYFPLKSILEQLNIKRYVDYFKLTNAFEYDLYEVLSTLIYARSVHPCSKNKTFHDVLPCLHEPYNYSYDQLLDGVAFLGENYEKFVEIFTAQLKATYGMDTAKTYFDCTNFYFEIDREDDFRRKGPSKENSRDPIVGLGLLLDAHQIPIGMKMYPGNESEKPVLRDVIDQLKRQNQVVGKTIHVADKGLNCAKNIAFSKMNGDGYLFSKSVKGLPEKEKVWVLLNEGFKEVKDSQGKVLYYYKSCVDKFPYPVEHDGKTKTIKLTEKRLLTYNPTLASKKRHEINRMVEKAKALTLSQAKRAEFGETGKYVNFVDADGEKAAVGINQDAIDKDLMFAGYNLLVTSETEMKDLDIYNTYHNLWRIEEAFRIMKSDLDARPVFLRTEETIKGHFLICYCTVLLERIFQYKILDNEYSASEIFSFMKGFKVTKGERKYINTTINSKFIEHLADRFKLPLTHYFLTETQVKGILNAKIQPQTKKADT